jgi:hypothetical protein
MFLVVSKYILVLAIILSIILAVILLAGHSGFAEKFINYIFVSLILEVFMAFVKNEED